MTSKSHDPAPKMGKWCHFPGENLGLTRVRWTPCWFVRLGPLCGPAHPGAAQGFEGRRRLAASNGDARVDAEGLPPRSPPAEMDHRAGGPDRAARGACLLAAPAVPVPGLCPGAPLPAGPQRPADRRPELHERSCRSSGADPGKPCAGPGRRAARDQHGSRSDDADRLPRFVVGHRRHELRHPHADRHEPRSGARRTARNGVRARLCRLSPRARHRADPDRAQGSAVPDRDVADPRRALHEPRGQGDAVADARRAQERQRERRAAIADCCADGSEDQAQRDSRDPARRFPRCGARVPARGARHARALGGRDRRAVAPLCSRACLRRRRS